MVIERKPTELTLQDIHLGVSYNSSSSLHLSTTGAWVAQSVELLPSDRKVLAVERF